MPCKHVHHVKVTVSNLDRSIAFYCDQLGFELIYQADRENLSSYDTIMNMQDVKLRIAMLTHSASGFMLALIEFQNPPSVVREVKNNYVGPSSLALEVDDARAEFDRLSAAGVMTMSGPTEIMREGRSVSIAFYFLDPDKIPIEIWQALDS